ncbi:MAG: cation diffusion facilitator family transporter [Verrucomicrobia bacterium]|nr:cation diffusion facilitator family transporter [Verrucomicrobiota bacterium]MCG2681855.1 cation diffusion facilitator family transporter [Kiritimatiellia bacterium]MBU4247734.1 cation diffusion facilitator family transporter [Verrucomicrobiota bacterium]MBU4291614.1 cation diffusion facilitator family transporter [Verrucomicrobiota bacterium]MBU4429569.1 cation diffusion facilitator family transporter [Verrucomicrobiota bacterium]
MNIHHQKIIVAAVSVVSNSFLVLSKIIIGLLIGSVAVISEGIHSAVDLLAAFIALFAVWMVKHPADKNHPFGHGKVENISGTVEALLIFLAAAWIIKEAIEKLIHPSPLGATSWGVGIMLLSSLVNIGVSRLLFVVGRKSNSVALQADAWHLMTDVYTSAGVMFGLLCIWIGNFLFPHLYLDWIDPIAAILVALLIVKAAWKLTIESGRDLLDISLPLEEETWIQHYLHSLHPTVRGLHNLRTRKAGADRFVDCHVLVRADMSVEESHEITRTISGAIRQQYPGTTVTIHIEPCRGTCPPECLQYCQLHDDDRERILDES